MEFGQRGLADLIFSWSLNDILNRDLYLNKVGKIPTTFSSVDQYMNSFINPIIEETHADLCSSMKAVSQAQTCKILLHTASRGHNMYGITFLKGIETRNEREEFPQGGDVVLLSSVCPTNLNYLKRSPKSFILGIIDKGRTSDRIRTSKPINVHQMPGSTYAVYLMNATTNIRIWEALKPKWHKSNKKQKWRKPNLSIIKEVLHANPTVGIDCDHCSYQQIGASTKDVDIDSFSLNESQTDVVLSSMQTSRCNHKNTVKLIWGPPGTGKTKTVAALLWGLLKLKCRTLVCAPTNTAVVEVTSRLLKLLKESLQNECYGIGDVVMFGNAGRMRIDDNADLLDVFLDYRAEELEKCSSEWNLVIDSMISLLEDPSTKYSFYLETTIKRREEMEKDKGQTDKDEIRQTETEQDVLTVREFFRKQFRFINGSLNECIRNLCTNLPTAFISLDVVQHMKKAADLLDHIGTLLSSYDLTTVDLKKTSHPCIGVGSTELSELLFKGRAECLEVLTSLRDTFCVPEFNDTKSIKNFCLQNAHLIFCTTSSSSTIWTKDMKPLKMLVIDEAAQLKECESVIPLLLPDIKHAIFVGDECQLPAMIKSKICSDADFGRSMFERLVKLGQRKHLLNVQYRMHPSISLFPNTEFYGNQILDSANVKESVYTKHFLQGDMYGPYSFINVAYGKEVLANGHSPRNPVECAVICEIIAKLYEASVSINQRISVGIISPYNAQVFALQKKLDSKYEAHSKFSLRIRSVDGFQGGEEDVIVISTVRSYEKGQVGFLDKHQRTNVALTRARYCLWIVGNEPTLAGSDTIWKKLVLNAKDRGQFFNAEDDARLAEGIVGAMVELGQLDDLLNVNSILFRGTRWKVYFGDGFQKSLERIKGLESRKEVIFLLKKLSSGWRNLGQNQKFLNLTTGTSSQLLKQIKIKGGMLHLLWSVDICKERSKYIQVMKFWDILPLRKIPKLVEHLNFIFRSYTVEKIDVCNFKCREGELEVPMRWDTNVLSLDDIQETEALHLSNRLASLNFSRTPGSQRNSISF